jgi:hypothetical protein
MGNSMDRVHSAWIGRRDWVQGGPVDGVDRRVLGSSLAGAEKGEGSTGVLLRASPEIRSWCGDRAMAMKRRWRRSSTAVAIKLGGRGKIGGGGAVRSGGGHLHL